MSTATLPTGAVVPARPLALLAAGLAAAAATAALRAGPPDVAGPPPAATAPAPVVAAPPVIPNAGQSPAAVRFEARASGAALYFTGTEVVAVRPTGTMRLGFRGAG